MDHSPPGSSVHRILQARILEWLAIPFSRGSSRPRDPTHVSYVSCTGRWVLYHYCPLGSPTLHKQALCTPHPRYCSLGIVFVCLTHLPQYAGYLTVPVMSPKREWKIREGLDYLCYVPGCPLHVAWHLTESIFVDGKTVSCTHNTPSKVLQRGMCSSTRPSQPPKGVTMPTLRMKKPS